MRLDRHEIDAIKKATREVFGTDAIVSLFGSRTRDDLKGGDIDLLFEVKPGADTLENESRFLTRLFEDIEERKVDIVILTRGSTPSAFARLACRQAVRLP